MVTKKVCKICKKELNKKSSFYFTNNYNKYSDGYLDICKDCMTRNVNNFNPHTYLWILQECDVPYHNRMWNLFLKAYPEEAELGKNKILDKYLIRMRLMSFKDFRWKDSPLFYFQNEGGNLIG